MRQESRERAAEIERLHGIERLKSDFYNAAAHELGTPLTPIKVQLQLLKGMVEANGDRQQRKSIEILDRNVDRLSKLTRDLLDVARLQSGGMRIDRQSVPLAQIIREAEESFGPVAKAHGITFEVRAIAEAFVDVDAKRISQVIYNLVSNAIKFTPYGGRVSIEAVEQPSE